MPPHAVSACLRAQHGCPALICPPWGQMSAVGACVLRVGTHTVSIAVMIRGPGGQSESRDALNFAGSGLAGPVSA